MADKEFGRVCQKCKKKGGDTFARMYYKPIDGKWLRLCSVCWEAVEQSVQRTCARRGNLNSKKVVAQAANAPRYAALGSKGI